MLKKTILWFNEISPQEEFLFGGKINSLCKMLSLINTDHTIKMPQSSVISTDEFDSFLAYNNIDHHIKLLLNQITLQDITFITSISKQIYNLIIKSKFSEQTVYKLKEKYILMTQNGESLAVRSSSCDEDGCEHSFAGQQNSYLHITTFDDLLIKIKLVYASLYSTHAISYRLSKKICLASSKMAVLIQHMIRSDKGCAGVIFTEDPHTKNNNFISISANYGLGESIVQGISNPDEYIIFKEKDIIIQKNFGSKNNKVIYNQHNSTICTNTNEIEKTNFCLDDEKIIFLSIIGKKIEHFFGHSVDIEWGLDGIKNEFYILQVRAITTKNDIHKHEYDAYTVNTNIKDKIIITGKAIGKKVITGKVKIIHTLDTIETIQKGDILVTNITDPHWEPAMKRASGIITNLGGRTCHAAIIARELEIPAIVGTNVATHLLHNEQEISIICCHGDIGYICDGIIPYVIEKRSTKNALSRIKNTKIMLNIGNPSIAFEQAILPAAGVGLTRMEYIINNYIGIHPQAIMHYHKLSQEVKNNINMKIIGYHNPENFYINKLIEGLATIASAFYPRPVTIRLSDFKTNEYRNLLGGEQFEFFEENPMIGYRGAMRYLSEEFKDAFIMELKALHKLIYTMHLTNISLLIPFVRTVKEAQEVIQLLSMHGIKRSSQLKIYIMCEVPSNVILAKEFLAHCDGFSIGSNDLTQLTLGIDRDGNKLIQEIFDENSTAVKKMIEIAIKEAKSENKYIGICGQGPSDNIAFATWLIDQNIDSISLVPDSFFQFCDQVKKK